MIILYVPTNIVKNSISQKLPLVQYLCCHSTTPSVNGSHPDTVALVLPPCVTSRATSLRVMRHFSRTLRLLPHSIRPLAAPSRSAPLGAPRALSFGKLASSDPAPRLAMASTTRSSSAVMARFNLVIRRAILAIRGGMGRFHAFQAFKNAC